MTTQVLRFVLALGLAGAFALAAADAADAKNKRAAYKKPRPHALVTRPYVQRPTVREPACVTQYDEMGVPVPDHFHCESAFRRLYSR